MGADESFDGHPVLTFGEESDRRNFLRRAGLVGVGASLAAPKALDTVDPFLPAS